MSQRKSYKKNQDNSSPTWIPTVLLPTLLVAVIVGVVCYWQYWSCNSKQWNHKVSSQADYQLAGDESWVKGRQWLLYEATNRLPVATSDLEGLLQVKQTRIGEDLVLTHPDWATKYTWAYEPASDCINYDNKEDADKADELAQCAMNNVMTIELDREMDSFLGQWQDGIMLSKWQEAEEILIVDDEGQRVLSEAQVETVEDYLNEWIDELLLADWRTKKLDIYLATKGGVENEVDGAQVAMLIWTLENKQQSEQKIVSTELEFTKQDETDAWGWLLRANTLPRTSE